MITKPLPRSCQELWIPKAGFKRTELSLAGTKEVGRVKPEEWTDTFCPPRAETPHLRRRKPLQVDRWRTVVQSQAKGAIEVMGDNRHDKGWQGHHYFLKKQRKGPVFIKEIDREGNEHLVHTGHRSYDSAMRWLNRYVGQQFAEKDEHPERIPLPHPAQVHVSPGLLCATNEERSAK